MLKHHEGMPYDVAAVRAHFPALRDGAAHFDTLPEQVQDRAEALDSSVQGVELGRVRLELDRVGQVMRIDRRGLVAGRSGARVELAVHLDPDILQGDLLVGGLDQVGMGQATRQRAEQEFG